MPKLPGLTTRALRFYEARGLVKPLRTASGRRHFGPAELEQLHRVMAMKRAGLTLGQIQRFSNGRVIDLRDVIIAQMESLDERRRGIDQAHALLASILSRIDRSEPIDVATFCSLIQHGETTMSEDRMNQLVSRYMTAEQKQALDQSIAALPPDFDNQAHYAKWRDLTGRIKAALPMDPASPQAQAFLDEWGELIKPYLAVATPEMLAGVRNFNEHVEEWEGEEGALFDAEAFRFHQEAARAREARQQNSPPG